MAAIELRGDAVVLRPLSFDDVAALAAASAESREHYGFNPVPDGADECRRYVEFALRQRDAGLRLPFAVIFHGRPVGSTSYAGLETWTWPAGSPLPRHGRPDIAEIGDTWLAQSAQRTRCNTEAKYLLRGRRCAAASSGSWRGASDGPGRRAPPPAPPSGDARPGSRTRSCGGRA